MNSIIKKRIIGGSMKKLLAILLSLMLIIGLTACGGDKTPDASTDSGKTDVEKETVVDDKAELLKVVNLINGNLGDKSFHDSCEAGLAKLKEEGYIDYKTIQMGATEADRPKWKSTLQEVSEQGDYDVIVVGTYNMQEYLEEVAVQFPDQKYISYDAAIDLPNVASITYKQNELGYLIGILAATFTTDTSIENVNPEKVIGFIGGGDIPVINDFLVGYIEGAKFVDPDIKIDAQYVGGTSGWSDPATAKELSNVMISQYKVDAIWNVAGGSGNGMAEACAELGAWFIGVDSDQEQAFSEAQPELAAVTITSGLKRVDNSLIAVFKDIIDNGASPWGTTTELGLAEGGVGVATEGNYSKFFGDEVSKIVDKAKAGIDDGSIVVSSAFGMETSEIEALRNEVTPRK